MLDKLFRNAAPIALSAPGICWRCQIQRQLRHRSFRSVATSPFSTASQSQPKDRDAKHTATSKPKKKEGKSRGKPQVTEAQAAAKRKARAALKHRRKVDTKQRNPKASATTDIDVNLPDTATSRGKQLRLRRHLARLRKEGTLKTRGLLEVGTYAEATGSEDLIKKVVAKDLPEIYPKDLEVKVINKELGHVPRLAHGLERALFNRGILQFRDLHSRVYNVDPALEMIPPLDRVDFESLSQFIPPSKDEKLAQIAKENGKTFIGSTSSLTGLLKHFHFLLSAHRGLNFNHMSLENKNPSKFSKITMAPEAIILRYQNGVYSADADKEFDSANVLSLMGRYLEKYFTVDMETFEKHKVGKSHLHAKDMTESEAYHYSTVDDFLMRSQLDAYDPRLPGTGIFDLKTRACLPIRMDTQDFEWGMDYEMTGPTGNYTSYEREYADMARATMLKYALQARIGRMDGIFVAYHNIARIFGFQYIPINEMDLTLHGQGDRCLGDQEFVTSMHLLNKLVKQATKRFPQQSLRIFVVTREATSRGTDQGLHFYAEPITTQDVKSLQSSNKDVIAEWEAQILGLKEEPDGPAKQGTESTETSSHVTLKSDIDRFRARARNIQDARVRSLADKGSNWGDKDLIRGTSAAKIMPSITGQESETQASKISAIEDSNETHDAEVAISTATADASEAAATLRVADEAVAEPDTRADGVLTQTSGSATITPTPMSPDGETDQHDLCASTAWEEFPSLKTLTEEEVSQATETNPASTPKTPRLTPREAFDRMFTDRAPHPPSPSPKASATPDSDTDKGPLFAAVLQISHTINGKRQVRPTDLKPTDVWKVGYTIKEYDTPAKAWRGYETTKLRRKKLLDKTDRETKVAEQAMAKESGEAGRPDYYMDMIRRATEDAKMWRERVDKRDSLQEKKDGGVRVWDRTEPVKRDAYVARASGV